MTAHHSGEHNIKSKDLRGCDSERFRYQPFVQLHDMISAKPLNCVLLEFLPSGPPGSSINSVLITGSH